MNPFKQWLDRSLGRRIGVLVSVLLLLVSGAVSAVSYYQVLQVAREGADTRLGLVGRQLADMLGRGPAASVTALSRVAGDSTFIRALVRAGGPDTAAAAAMLRQLLPANSRAVIGVFDGTGEMVLEAGLPAQTRWFGPSEIAIPTGGRLGPLVALGDTTIYYDVRVPVRGGSLVERTRMNMTPEGARMLNSLVGAGAKVMIGSPATGAWTDLVGVAPGPPSGTVRVDSASTYVLGGEARLGVAREVVGLPWVVLVSLSQTVVDAPARAYLRRAILVAVIAMILGTLAAAGLGHRLSSPIKEITQVTEHLAAGDIGNRANEASPGEIGRLAHSFNAMLERVSHSSDRLRESETSLRAFVSHSSQGIWHLELRPPLDTRGPPEYQIDQWYLRAPMAECNPALAGMLGLESTGDLVQIPLEHIFPRDDARNQELLREFIANGYLASQAESHGEQRGEIKRIFVNDLIGLVEGGVLLRIWGTRRDVTLERMLDERLAQSQRLEAIGRLAGGVSHDFNNLLTVILAHSELLMERMPAGSDDAAGVREIRQTAQRAAQLTRQLLLFSRGQVARPTVLDLNEVTTSVEGMLRRVIGEDINLVIRLTPELARVRADQGQIEQVLMNLVVNARDAMPAGGSLELRTGEVTLDEEYVKFRPTLQPGRYVMLAVTDSGTGMSAEVQQHAFEPFFTTKSKGQGTGLGLATVYGIARQSGGDVAIYSEAGKGTSVKVFLPARADAAVPAAAAVRPVAANGPGHETILVIEDEPALRDMVRRALVATGYNVLDAGDGTEAIRLSESNGAIDLVLTDMILPGMSGREILAEFRRRRPTLPIIIMSGYTGETYPALEALPAGVGYLEKPFSLADLRTRVRESLDEPPN